MRALIFAGLTAVTLLSSGANAHGYVTISRGKKCQDNLNSDCGSIQYEPQSLEGPKGYPNGGGPPDGQLGSAGIGSFTRLNEQSSTRWHKTDASTGSYYTFTWQFTANHRTSGYEYYITRPDWNQNAPLTRSTFESSPFCSIGWDGSQPPLTVSHTCNIPSDHTGYHVVMAVWTIADTANAFYNMIDLNLNHSGNNSGGGGGSGSNNGGGGGESPPTTASCGGGSQGNGVCDDGSCCSQWGWCGCTTDHCTGGQTCGGSSSSPPSSPRGTCGGGSQGDGICSNGMCCSPWGWCGCTSAYCTDAGQHCLRRLRGSGFKDDIVEAAAAAVEQVTDERMFLGNNTTRLLSRETLLQQG